MKIAFDHDSGSGAPAPDRERDAPEGFSPRPDWADLRARLFAAHEVRTVLSGQSVPLRLRTRGSFAGGTACLLNTYGTDSSPVNLDVSTNGKPGGGKVTSVAGADEPGERG